MRVVMMTFFLMASSIVALAQEEEEQGPQPVSRQEILQKLRREKAANLEPYEVSGAEKRARNWEKAKFPQNWLVKGWHGFRPVFGGMPSGSGFVFGGGYIHGLESQYFQFQANGRYSTRGYTSADAEVVFPPPQIGRRIEIKFRGEYRDLTSLRFYGLGNDSSLDDRSTYLLNDQSGMGYLWLNPRGLLSLGAQGGWLSARTDSGDAQRSIEDVFEPGEVPGFMGPRTDFVVAGGWGEFDLRNKWSNPAVGVVARITGERYEDTGLSRYDFTRVIADVKGYIPLGPKSRILALRFYTSQSVADSGKEVPFYLMETLGGAKTIRGYREWRFRDTRNLYVAAEYRWEVMPFVDFTFFLDAGKVFADKKDFNFDRMHTGYGFGIRMHAPGGMAFRMDFANSTEGFIFHISAGPAF